MDLGLLGTISVSYAPATGNRLWISSVSVDDVSTYSVGHGLKSEGLLRI